LKANDYKVTSRHETKILEKELLASLKTIKLIGKYAKITLPVSYGILTQCLWVALEVLGDEEWTKGELGSIRR